MRLAGLLEEAGRAEEQPRRRRLADGKSKNKPSQREESERSGAFGEAGKKEGVKREVGGEGRKG